MLAAIERPKPEVWPHQFTRIQLAFAMLFPRVADFVMAKYHQSVVEANRR